jgi:hypothetical protein
MFSIGIVASMFILLVANQTALSQPQNSAKFLNTASSSVKAEKHPNSKSKLPSYRIDELNRRAHDPGSEARNLGPRPIRAEYAEIVAGIDPLWQSDILRIKNTKPMPPTDCKSVYMVAKDPERPTEGPWRAHELSIHLFTSQSGFGFWRMLHHTNSRGKTVGSSGIDRVELVSLMTTDEPSVYVLDEVAEPPKARLAHRRPLDKFEQLGLNAVRQGHDLVGTKEAPNRMFGAIRAEENCLECHTAAKKNDLLGAFTYYLETSVDGLERHREPLPPYTGSQ